MAPTVADEVSALERAVTERGGTLLRVHEAPAPGASIALDVGRTAFVDAGFDLGGGVFYVHTESDPDLEDAPYVALTAYFLRGGWCHAYHLADPEWESGVLAGLNGGSENHDYVVELQDANPTDIVEDMVAFAEDNELDVHRDTSRIVEEYWEDLAVDLDDLTKEERRVVTKANSLFHKRTESVA